MQDDSTPTGNTPTSASPDFYQRHPKVRQRFFAKVQKTDGCWIWTAAKLAKGYGRFFLHIHPSGVRVQLAHRVAYEMMRGPIPDGLVIDHLCRNTSCVNPDHLEAVTIRENTVRGESELLCIHRRGYCRRGHPRTPENLLGDGRTCRLCSNMLKRDKRRRMVGFIPGTSVKCEGCGRDFVAHRSDKRFCGDICRKRQAKAAAASANARRGKAAAR